MVALFFTWMFKKKTHTNRKHVHCWSFNGGDIDLGCLYVHSHLKNKDRYMIYF